MAYIEKREGRPKPWRVRYREGGETRSASFRIKPEANDFLHKLEADRARGHWLDPRSGARPFGDYAAEIMEGKRKELRSASFDRDESHLRIHILPRFGSTALSEISRSAVKAWVGKLSDDKGLAPRTVRECYRILGGIMREAVHDKLINESPCYRVTLPRVEKTEQRFMTTDEVRALADAFDPRYRALVLTGAYLGLRWGELAGLKRAHISLEKRRVRIVGALERNGNGWRYSENLKTKAARRTLSLPSFLADVLSEHLETATESEYVFAAPEGGFLRYHSFRRRFWNPAVESAGIEYATPHALRHTCAALMIDQGANPVLVQKRLGHADIRITLGEYGHRFPNQDEDIVTNLDALYSHAQAAPHTRPKVVDLSGKRAAK